MERISTAGKSNGQLTMNNETIIKSHIPNDKPAGSTRKKECISSRKAAKTRTPKGVETHPTTLPVGRHLCRHIFKTLPRRHRGHGEVRKKRRMMNGPRSMRNKKEEPRRHKNTKDSKKAIKAKMLTDSPESVQPHLKLGWCNLKVSPQRTRRTQRNDEERSR